MYKHTRNAFSQIYRWRLRYSASGINLVKKCKFYVMEWMNFPAIYYAQNHSYKTIHIKKITFKYIPNYGWFVCNTNSSKTLFQFQYCICNTILYLKLRVCLTQFLNIQIIFDIRDMFIFFWYLIVEYCL